MDSTSTTWGKARKDRSHIGRPSLESFPSEDNTTLEAGEDSNLMDETKFTSPPTNFRSLKACACMPKRFLSWLTAILLAICLIAVLMVVLVISVIDVEKARSQGGGETVWTDCGQSPTEARSRGCSFDMLSHAWQTKECYDHETSEAFRQAGEWEYYLDRDGKYPVSEDIVIQGETEVWARESMHYVHCTYMWRQMHRAFTVLHHIDTHLNNFNHTLHCQKVFIDTQDSSLLEVWARLLYPACHPV